MTEASSKPLRMGARDWGLLLLLATIWGSSFFFYRVMIREIGAPTIVFGREFVAAAALNLFLLAGGQVLRFPLGVWVRIAFLGIINNVLPFTLIAYSETRITGGTAALLHTSVPMLTTLTAHFLTHDERFTWNRGVGVVFGIVGVGILIGADALRGLNGDFIGDLICLTAAVSYAFAAVYSRAFPGIPPLQLAAGQVTMGALIALPVMLILNRPWNYPLPSLPVWGGFLATGLIGTAFAYIMFFRLVRRSGAMNLSLVALLQPVSAMFLGWFFLSEPVAPNAFLGMGIIGTGLVCIDGRILRWCMSQLSRIRTQA